MNRKTVVAALLGTIMLLGASAAQAALSLHNPYRSFNSGVNYGAQQWEHSHRCHHGERLKVRHR